MPEPPERSSRPSLAARMLREPMVHFLIAGVAVFALQALVSGPPAATGNDTGRIVITEGRVQQLVQIFARTWQRPPTAAELRGLIDAYVKEEVYYREAVRLGLDRDDTLVRRRMQQKMEFLIEPDDAELTPTKAQLQAWLKAKRDSFRTPRKVAFEQIFISIERDNPQARAAAIMEELHAAQRNVSPATFGDRTLLPPGLPLTPVDVIARDFGRTFADALPDLPRGKWAGPVRSPYGLHVVRVRDYAEAVDPPFEEIRKAVEREWRQAQRRAHMQAEYERLRAKYDVVPAFAIRRASLK